MDVCSASEGVVPMLAEPIPTPCAEWLEVLDCTKLQAEMSLKSGVGVLMLRLCSSAMLWADAVGLAAFAVVGALFSLGPGPCSLRPLAMTAGGGRLG